MSNDVVETNLRLENQFFLAAVESPFASSVKIFISSQMFFETKAVVASD